MLKYELKHNEIRVDHFENIANVIHLCFHLVYSHIHFAAAAAEPVVHGPLTRYVRLPVAPGIPGTLSTPSTSKETASKRSRHASRHVRDARAMMHVGITSLRWRGNVPGIPGACATRNFTYLSRGPLHNKQSAGCRKI